MAKVEKVWQIIRKYAKNVECTQTFRKYAKVKKVW